MIKEYKKFIKDYMELSQTSKKYFILMLVTAIGYKVFGILRTLFAAWIIKYVTNTDLKMTTISIILVGLSYALYHLVLFINIKIYGKNMEFCYTTLQTRLFNKVINVDDNFTKKISKGKLVNSINKDAIDIGDMCDQVTELYTTIIQVIIVEVLVAIYSIPMAILLLIYTLIYIYIRNRVDRKGSIYFKKQKHEVDRYSNLFSQILSGLQEIKTFDMLDRLKHRLNEIKNKYSKSYVMKRKYFTIRDNDVRFITHGVKIIFYIILVLLMKEGTITIDILVLIIGYFESNVSHLDKVISITSKIREVNVSVERIDNILNYKNSNDIIYGDINYDLIDGIVEFNKVRFGYNDKEILKGISFKVKTNSLTAIVGPSGTGKTSIFNLLLRLYKPTEGKISIDDVDIYDYTKEVYGSNVSVVNQKPFIFNMSIRKNLDFVDSSIENQIEACKRVGIHDFITSLPQGYNTILRENGNNISGGQKQLISLARTLLSKSEILLFDEITSSLDPDTADHIKKVLKDLKKDHTIIMITHKPEMMKIADRILVLYEGKIVADGTHKYLLENSEHYRFLQARKSASKLGVFTNDKVL